MKKKIHPTNVISGYRLAMKEACDYIENHLAIPVESLGKDALLNAAKTSMASKILDADSAFFSDMVVKAVNRVKTTDKKVLSP